MAELIWSPIAMAQFTEIIEYIARDSDANSIMVARELQHAAELARVAPLAGSIVPEYEQPHIRECLVCGYRLIYRVRPRSITIALVHRGSRPLPKRLP